MQIEKNIKNYIKDNHINKTVLAGEMKITQQALEEFLSRNEELTADEIVKFCKALKIDANTIFYYGD